MTSPIRASSTSFSSTGSPCKHDVFLSFRGKDTRMGFTGHLYDALTRQGINTFRDDEKLRVGDLIGPELLEAIAASRFGIVVLSSDYATSTWCLEELAEIVECMEKKNMIVIPVFYHVDPSDVRYQNKTFAQSFAKHETSNRYASEKVKTWRAALRKVGDLSGVHVQGTRYESEVITEIVRRIFKNLQDTLPRDATKGLVGIESRVEELKNLLNMDSNDIRFIGICGMSGMGKTTLAEVVYEGIRNQFQGYSFIGNIKDISRKNDNDLCKLQRKLLVDILKDEHIRVSSVVEGVSMLRERLRGFKILIVLDDVNNREQLKLLAGEREWFGHGSRIIMTTTNEDLLTIHKVDGKYKCEGLNFFDATRLFNLSAFTEGQPKHGYEKLSNDIVELAGGLPLALNAFGSLLFDKGEEYWRETLKKLQQFPEEEVLQRLEICYRRLDKNEQDVFIHIACFLKGRNQELVNDILKNIGLYPVRGIDILINRSLITINYDDTVWIHDLLQQVGWEVLRKDCPKKPGERTGIMCREDIVDICTLEEKGTKTIEIINQEQYGAEVENCIGDPESFSQMKKLKFLRISNVLFPYGLKYLSNDLRIVEWYGCSLKCFPPTFGPKQIYELDMRSSRLEKLWDTNIDFPNMRSLNLRGSEDLTKIQDLKSTPNLLKLNLEGCTNLVELHKSLLAHKRLRYVNLKGCRNLRSLGNHMEMDGLEALLLSGCSKLEHIPEFGENMKRLEHLYLDGTKIKLLPESLGKMRSLRKLDVSETAIKELPSFILQLERLRLLHINGCRLHTIPDGIGLLYSLKELDLSGNDFVTLPASISLLSNLRMLSLNCCRRLESLPKLSKINEDTLYGGEIRFSHYISEKRLDVSKFRSSSHNINPTVSCLNCPKLIENQSGSGLASGLANTILKKYLQVRIECAVIPEAIFEIVSFCAGSKIPQWFELQRYRDQASRSKGTGTKHQGLRDVFDVDFDKCIGVALCAVIVVPHSLVNMRGAYIEVKYEIIAHIRVADKYWRKPVPINFLEAKFDTQLVWYWTVTDDYRRAVVDPSQMNQFHISFSVEPEGGNLEVKKFGVRFLCREDILKLGGKRDSTNGIPSIVKVNSLRPQDLRWYKVVSDAFNSSFQDHTGKVITTLATGFKHGSISLDSLREVVESVLEMNQEVVKVILECKEEIWKDKQLFSLVMSFFSEVNLPILKLCGGLMKFLKGTGDRWLIVQVAMQQIEAKRRAGTLNYLETTQQLIDLEVAKVPFSAKLITLFQTFSEQQVAALRRLSDEMKHNMKSKSVKAHKVLNVTSAATLSAVLVSAVVDLRIAEQLPMMTTIDYDHVLHTWIDHWKFHQSLDWDVRISDFDGIPKLLEKLKSKMDWVLEFPNFVTKEDEEEIVISMNEIKKKISGCTKTIDDMSKHAYKCRNDTKLAHKEITPGFSINGSLSIVRRYQWSSEHREQDWGIIRRPVEELQSFNRRFQDHTGKVITTLATGFKHGSISLDFLREVIESLLEMNQEVVKVIDELKEEIWKDKQLFSFVLSFSEVDLPILKLCTGLMKLLKGTGDSWLIVLVVMQQIEAKRRAAGTLNYLETKQQLVDLEVAKVPFSAELITLFQTFLYQQAAMLRRLNDEMKNNMKLKSVKYNVTSRATVSAVLVSAVVALRIVEPLRMIATIDYDHVPIDPLPIIDWWYWDLLDLDWDWDVRISDWLLQFRRSVNYSENLDWDVRISDFDGIPKLLKDLESKMDWMLQFPDLVTKEKEEEEIVISEIKKKISGCTKSIDDMSKHAYKCRNDTKQARNEITSGFSINGSLSIVRRYQWNSEHREQDSRILLNLIQSFNQSFKDHTRKVITILTTGFKDGSFSLDSLREAIESLLEMNREVVKFILERKEEIWKDKQLFSLVLSVFSEDLPILKLCTGLMKFLNGTGDSWLIVQVAMQQIEAKIRAGTLNYLETMQQLIIIDLVVAEVPFSAKLIKLFQTFSNQQVAMLRRLSDEMKHKMKSTSVTHNVTSAATLSAVLVSAVVALRIVEPLRTIDYHVLPMIEPLPMIDWWDGDWDWDWNVRISDWLFQFGRSLERYDKDKTLENYSENLDWDVRISDFDGIPELLKDLESKMDWMLQFPDLVTKEKEEEIVNSMDEIKKKISGCTKSIDDLSKHAYKCRNDTKQARNEITSGSREGFPF